MGRKLREKARETRSDCCWKLHREILHRYTSGAGKLGELFITRLELGTKKKKQKPQKARQEKKQRDGG